MEPPLLRIECVSFRKDAPDAMPGSCVAVDHHDKTFDDLDEAVQWMEAIVRKVDGQYPGSGIGFLITNWNGSVLNVGIYRNGWAFGERNCCFYFNPAPYATEDEIMFAFPRNFEVFAGPNQIHPRSKGIAALAEFVNRNMVTLYYH